MAGRHFPGATLAAFIVVLGTAALSPAALAQTEEAATQAEAAADHDTSADEASHSNYAKTVPASGTKSVGAELIQGDKREDTLFDVNWTDDLFPGHYRRKKNVNQRYGIAFNTDYSTLAQYASDSSADKDAASSVFRVYGNWLASGSKDAWSGSLVFKYEHRGAIFGDQTPRDLGFNTGSALSTANYKENGWGMTDFYWRQDFDGNKHGFLVGHMDPGDWADQHSLLNAWTALMNDAFYNNPTEAIPKRGFSLVGRIGLYDDWYMGGGIHDANGKDNELDFTQVFDTPELFTWVELGRRSKDYAGFGDTTHVHYWHQDERVEAGVEESWGVTASSSKTFDNGIIAVVRAGYSEGDAPQMREFLGVATSFPVRGSDTFKFGVGWGSPPDKSLGSQTVFEFQYRLHVTHNLTVSPDLMVTFNPSFTQEEDVVYVLGLRMRLTL